MLNEYELIGDMASSYCDGANGSGALLPPQLSQGYQSSGVSINGAEGNQGGNKELKKTLMRTLLAKRTKLQRLYQRKRQIKLIEKRQK